MKIAYLNAGYRKEVQKDCNSHVWYFIKHAAELGHEVWAVYGDESEHCRIMPRSHLGKLMVLRAMDVFYMRQDDCPKKLNNFAVAPFRYLIGPKIIVWEFNVVPEFGYLIGKGKKDVKRAERHFRRLGPGCDLAVCTSRPLEHYVTNNFGIQRTLVVEDGADPDQFRPDIPPIETIHLRSDALNVVWMGSTGLPWHDFRQIRGAAELLWQGDRRSNITFHILGDITESVHGMPPNVLCHGYQDYRKLPNWLAAMHVGLCLYVNGVADNCSPLKLFEYMASGLAAVATPQPQIQRVFNELGQTDLLVPPGDSVALADVLVKLASDRAGVRRRGADCRRRVIDFYNWGRAVRCTVEEIERIVEEREKNRDARFSERNR